MTALNTIGQIIIFIISAIIAVVMCWPLISDMLKKDKPEVFPYIKSTEECLLELEIKLLEDELEEIEYQKKNYFYYT